MWLHFPKCAGTKTENLFHRYFSDRQDIHQDAVDIVKNPGVSWHDSLAEREQRDVNFSSVKRLVICPIRRLPAWLESRYNFEVARSPQFDHRADRLLTGHFLTANGKIAHADAVARRYLPGNLLASPRLVFLRTEFFREDFARIFAPFIDVDRIPAEEFAIRENASPDCLPSAIRQRLLYDNDNLYEHCPIWKKVEQLAYNSNSARSTADNL